MAAVPQKQIAVILVKVAMAVALIPTTFVVTMENGVVEMGRSVILRGKVVDQKIAHSVLMVPTVTKARAVVNYKTKISLAVTKTQSVVRVVKDVVLMAGGFVVKEANGAVRMESYVMSPKRDVSMLALKKK